jgi:hypothetical protein
MRRQSWTWRTTRFSSALLCFSMTILWAVSNLLTVCFSWSESHTHKVMNSVFLWPGEIEWSGVMPSSANSPRDFDLTMKPRNPGFSPNNRWILHAHFVSNGAPVHVIILPLWIPLAPTLVITIVILFLDRRSKKAGHCLECGYNLTGNVSGVCPECGSYTKAS